MADFHYGDVHVSLLGSYFTACVIFAAIYDKSPQGLPSVFQEYKIDKKTAGILRAPLGNRSGMAEDSKSGEIREHIAGFWKVT